MVLTSSPSTTIFKSLFTCYVLTAILYSSSIYIILPTISPLLADLAIALYPRNLTVPHHPDPVPTIQITPRLLPGDAHFVPHPDIQIRRTLKGTAVNTEEVVAEDRASLWTTPARHSTHSPHRALLSAQRIAVPGLGSSLSPPIQWYPPNHPLAGTRPLPVLPSTVRLGSESDPEDFFFSKAFGDCLGPSKVVPYFYRAKGPKNDGKFEDEDVTITTLVTSNRFQVFSRLAEHYQGPISATIHVSNVPETLEPLLASLEQMYRSSSSMSTWVDIHLVVDPFDRQFNMWRNVAKWFARTDYVLMLDVDFHLCTPFRAHLFANPKLMNLLRSGRAALVIPAFEFAKQSDGVDPKTFPSDKKALRELYKEGKVEMFHKSWIPGHGPTDYNKFFEPDEDNELDSYLVEKYTHSYEPYVIYKREGSPFCDERFIGYGGNKAACLFELYLSGVSFHVLPNDFLIHQSHPYAESTRQHERKFNRKLYADFREEVCFRKLYSFFQLGGLEQGTHHYDSKNLLGECKKIKGFTSVAARLMASSSRPPNTSTNSVV